MLLVEEYWLLTTGASMRPWPDTPVLLGTALAAVRDLERRDEVSWEGRGETATLRIRPECHCPEVALREWHELLSDYAGSEGTLPARFCLDPLLDVVWEDVGDRLSLSGAAVCYRNRRTDDLYGVRDVAGIRAQRESMIRAICPDAGGVGPEGVAPEPERLRELLLVAHASRSLDVLLRGTETELPGALTSAVGALVRSDAAAASRYRECVTHRDRAGWAYGPAAMIRSRRG